MDDLIENKTTLLQTIDQLLWMLFLKYDQREKTYRIGDLGFYISDFVSNGSFASLKENTEILEIPDYAYFIRNTDLKSGSFDRYVSKQSFDFLKKSSLQGNEILVSNVGDVGSVYLCPLLDKPMTIGNNMILMTRSNHDENYYFYMLLRSNYGQQVLRGITAGSAQQKFNKTDLKASQISISSIQNIKRFNHSAKALIADANKLKAQIRCLQSLKNTLLKEYFPTR